MLPAGRHSLRPEPWRRARAFVPGLLAPLPRNDCWSIAEQAGDATPHGMQHLLARARWDADGVRDEMRRFVIEHLGKPEPMLIADKTGDRVELSFLLTSVVPGQHREADLGQEGWSGRSEQPRDGFPGRRSPSTPRW
jgi:hypothetical protein